MAETTVSPTRLSPIERLREASLMGGSITVDQAFLDDLLAEVAALKRGRAQAVALAQAEVAHREAIMAEDARRYGRARILLNRATAFHTAACWVLSFALLFFFVATLALIGGRS